MGYRVVVHIYNEDPFVAEIDALPNPQDQFLVLRNPRRRDGKSLSFVTPGATHFLYPWTRIAFVEILEGEAPTNDRLITFFRDEP
jgi:hypothetical protein